MEKKLRQTLIRLFCVFLATLFVAATALFYGTLQSVFLQQVSESNDSLVQQVSATFELVMAQISEQIYKIQAYDDGLVQTVEAQEHDSASALSLYQSLNSISMGNKYIYSIHLYFPPRDRFYCSERGASYARETFYDPSVLPVLDSGRQGIVNPRFVRALGGETKLLSSIVLPLPATGDQPPCTLIANINAQLLYDDILKNMQVTGNHNVYIYNDQNDIMICRNPQELFTPVNEMRRETHADFLYWLRAVVRRSATLQSDARSAQLGWSFYLRTDIPLQVDQLLNRTAWLTGLILLSGVSIALCYLVIRASTHPLHDVVFALNEKMLCDLLLDTGHDHQSTLQQLERLDQKFEHERFLVAMCEAPHGADDLSPTLSDVAGRLLEGQKKLAVRVVAVRRDCAALIVNYTGADEQTRESLLRLLERIYEQLCTRYGALWLYAGNPRSSASQLASAYQECVSLQGCKLTLESRFAVFREPRPGAAAEYPAQVEKQLLNNLLVGNDEGCLSYGDKFFTYILRAENGLNDIQIKNYVYQLQNALLKRMSSLPISVRLTDDAGLDGLHTGREIREWFDAFLQTALEEINKKNARDESVLIQNIFCFIDENLLTESFNLNGLSYQFDLNRNYLARLIKEQSGYSFSDYVNRRKILLAMELLKDRSLTVETVAHRCGFSYAHYFIKIFKSVEGVTPGQYRETLPDNKNA